LWGFLFYYLLTAMRGMRGPFLLHVAHGEIPSATRAGMLSLQSLCFRLLFAVTGPFIGEYADIHGVRSSFRFLGVAYLLLLPQLVWHGHMRSDTAPDRVLMRRSPYCAPTPFLQKKASPKSGRPFCMTTT
jgi:hypothetical protein